MWFFRGFGLLENSQMVLGFHFAKVVWNITIYNWDPKVFKCFFTKCFTVLSWNTFHIYDKDTHFIWLSMWKRGFRKMCTVVKSQIQRIGAVKKNACSSLICCLALGRPAWNSLSEEQRWHPTFMPFQNLLWFKMS